MAEEWLVDAYIVLNLDVLSFYMNSSFKEIIARLLYVGSSWEEPKLIVSPEYVTQMGL